MCKTISNVTKDTRGQRPPYCRRAGDVGRDSRALRGVRVFQGDRRGTMQGLQVQGTFEEGGGYCRWQKIVIVKPGGKREWGTMKREDFLVFIYNPSDKSLWQIAHKQVFDDLMQKAEADRAKTIRILKAFEEVYNGEDPDDVLANFSLENPKGEDPEALLKAYKWIWGQEDVNYPKGSGRDMSWKTLKDLWKSLEQDRGDINEI